MIVCALLGAVYFYNRVDQEIRNAVQRHLAEVYPGFNVSVGSARLIERRGFEIQDVNIAEKPSGAGETGVVAFFDEIFVHCEPTIQGLLDGEINVQHVTIRRPVLHAVRSVDGQWNVRSLLDASSASGAPWPRVGIENGTVEVTDMSRAPYGRLTIRDVNLNLEPETATGETSVGSNAVVRYRGSFTSNCCQRTSCEGWIDPQRGDWSLKGSADHFVISPEMQGVLPAELAVFSAGLARLRTNGSLEFQLSRQTSRSPSFDYHIHAELVGGSWYDPRLKTPISDLQASLDLDRTGVTVDKLSARYGGAELDLSGRCNAPFNSPTGFIEGTTEGLVVDAELMALCPTAVQSMWRKFRPLGLIDGRFHLAYDGVRWKPIIAVQCLDVSLQWEKFTYPIVSARGQVTFGDPKLGDRRLVVDLEAGDMRHPIWIDADVDDPGPLWTGWFSANTDAWLPINERFVQALKPKHQRIVKAFSPEGFLKINAIYQRPPGATEVRNDVAIVLRQCSVRHEKFPYPISQLSGKLTKANQQWRFDELFGQNDDGVVEAEGHWNPDDRGGVLVLKGKARNVSIDEDLRQALSPNIRTQIQNLRLEGNIAEVDVDMEHIPTENETHLNVVLTHKPNDSASPLHPISASPHAFPYRIEAISGKVTYRDGQVWMEGLRGRHGRRVRMATEGHGSVDDSGDWSVEFDGLTVDQLRTDDDFLEALAPRFRRSVEQLSLDGPINLTGSLSFSGTADAKLPTRSQWDMAVSMEDVSFSSGIPLEHVSGSLRAVGRLQGNRFATQGELDIDSVTCHGIQFTRLKGPLWLDDQRLVLGQRAQAVGQQPLTERIQGRAFGGSVSSFGEVSLLDKGSFDLQIELSDGQFPHVLQEFNSGINMAEGTNEVGGLLSGQLRLQGVQQRQHLLSGSGSMQLRDADLYELPPVLALLNTIRSASSDRTAFNSADVAFTIRANQVYLDLISLQGDTLALKGKGEMNFDREINLNLYTVLGREDSSFPMMRTLLGMASQRFLLINAKGPLEDPKLTREVLPGLNETLQTLFPELSSAEPTSEEVEPLSPAKIPSTADAPPQRLGPFR